jgi:hypothetical protein
VLLPELAERDAAGGKARIYAEMKHWGGVPMVALIFRHLATLPGGIEWAWEAIGPAWRTGRLQQAAWKIARDAPLQPLAPIAPGVLAEAQVDGAALREIRIVLDAYNRANPENLLSVLCMRMLLAGADAEVAFEAADWRPPPAPGPLAPMADPAAMPAAISALLDRVSPPEAEGAPRVVPSLYRHFVHRPGFLALAVAAIAPRVADGSIDREAAAIRATMDEAARTLASGMRAPAAPDPGIATVLARFGGLVIPRMIVVGALLDRALPA